MANKIIYYCLENLDVDCFREMDLTVSYKVLAVMTLLLPLQGELHIVIGPVGAGKVTFFNSFIDHYTYYEQNKQQIRN